MTDFPKPLRRPVVAIDTSNQTDLFECGLEPGTGEQQAQRGLKEPGRVSFVDLDPHGLRLNEVPLRRYLSDSGQSAPLKVRALLQELDWSGFESAYKPGGRPPYAPRAMMGLILYGLMKGISSLRELESFARTDLGCLWISGGILPDHSIIGRFIQRHDALLSDGLFEDLTRQVLKLTGGGVSVVAGDATVIEAAASRYQSVRAEALAERLERQRQAQTETPSVQGAQRLEQLEQAQRQLAQRQARRVAKGKKGELQINCQDSEAVVQLQKDKRRVAASYKPSVLANEQRVILGVAVQPSSETQAVAPMLEQAQRHGQVETAMFDAGYFCQDIIELSEREQIELLCPEGQSQGAHWTKQSDKYYPKSRFEYFPEHDAYRCPAGALLAPSGGYGGNDRYRGYVLYSSASCSRCPQHAACTQSKDGRKLKRYASDQAKDALRKKMQDPGVRAR